MPVRMTQLPGPIQVALCRDDDAAGREVVELLAEFLRHLVSAAPTACEATPFDSLQAPAIGVQEYVLALWDCLGCSAECFVAAFVYIDRFMNKHTKCYLNTLNFHRMFLAAVVVAAKVLEDKIASNAASARIGGISNQEMNRLEVYLVSSLSWRVQVSGRECSDCIALLRLRASRCETPRPCEDFDAHLEIPSPRFPQRIARRRQRCGLRSTRC